jgi:hypothetical protein
LLIIEWTLNLNYQVSFKYEKKLYTYENLNPFWFLTIFGLHRALFFKNEMSIDFNDNFLINSIATKNYYEYDKLQKNWIIADMKPIFVITYSYDFFMLRHE